MNKYESVVQAASKAAYETDRLMVVGKDSSGEWVYREWEDPTSDELQCAVYVNAFAVTSEWQHARNLAED